MFKDKKIIFLILVVFTALLGWEYSKYLNSDLRIVFLDVGQGDAVLVRTPGRHNILIDGGEGKQMNNKNIISKLWKYLPFFDREFDMVISSHPHLDHLGGLLNVVQSIKVKRILQSGVKYNTAEYQEWNRLINSKNIDYDIAVSGKEYLFKSSQGDVLLKVLYPFKNMENLEVEDVNDYSVVVLLEYADRKILFTGDISSDVEKGIADYKMAQDIDVLKVAHQGSDTSTSNLFLDSFNPEYAVIMVGKNNYGQPSRRVLKRLERRNIYILRTDKMGDIEIRINKKGEIKVR